MSIKIQLFITIIVLSSFYGCNSKVVSQSYTLTEREKKICDSLQMDTTIIQDIRSMNTNKIEPFHYSLSKEFVGGKELESEPIHLKGIVFGEQNSKSYDVVFNLKDKLKQKGYTIFLLENNFNIDEKLDNIGVLKTTDKFTVLKQIATDGINYDITNDSLISIIKQFDNKYSLELIGASGDWCEFLINKEPMDWMTFAKEVYKVCPDDVDQGTGTIEALADEMKKTKRLYFWWD